MKIRLLRGQVVVRELRPKHSSIIHMLDDNPRSVKTHRGVVLQKGPPAEIAPGVPVPHLFEEGDEVVFHFEDHEGKRTRPWTDGENAVWLMQKEIDAVIHA